MSEREDAPDVGEEKKMEIVLYSFGFKHGVPIDANVVWDVRFLPNPYWQEELRPLNGLDRDVSAYVVESEQGRAFLRLLEPLLSFYVDAGKESGKSTMRIAVGCTGGRHRSVAIVEQLRRFFGTLDVEVSLFHRDIEREV